MIIQKLELVITEAFKILYGSDINSTQLLIQSTKSNIDGDFTVVVFPFTKISHKSLPDTANDLGAFILGKCSEIEKFNIINGFLNLTLKKSFWQQLLIDNFWDKNYGKVLKCEEKRTVIEFSSPNTNKPLHLGHIRNNLIGMAVSNILSAAGQNVFRVNLVNDRGVHICKSMLAWKKWFNNVTPESSNIKGDHLVGDCYVAFDKHYKNEIQEMIDKGFSQEEAKEESPLIMEAHEMLRQWERSETDVINLWNKMNSWVYEGFDDTYRRLGISFDKTYYESQTYISGKQIVQDAVASGLLTKDPDNSVWIDLSDEGLDRKLLLRKDGTSVYITQDLGTAVARYEELNPQKMIYVVGNEQLYHFDVLILTLKRLNYQWADIIHHLSYGMVELTTGKMKSREGTVVDADDLMDEMFVNALNIIRDQSRVSENDENKLADMVGMAALKYFILKVDPKKNMLFNPEESIDFNGKTGPFIQYTYARICSVLDKSNVDLSAVSLNDVVSFCDSELNILKLLFEYPNIINKAAEELSPSLIANYVYELSKLYNKFYQEINILKEENTNLLVMRLMLSKFVSNVIKSAMNILTIDVPERM